MTIAVDLHPTAVVYPGAQLGEGVRVGPYAVVRGTAQVGDHSEIASFAIVDEHTSLGAHTRVFSHACVGGEPQDLKFSGEISYLEAGDHNVFREFVTINRGTTGGGGITRIGSSNLFMAYVHVAHDCQIGSHTIFGNLATLAGHVIVEDWAIINAFAAVQQFCRIGAHAYMAGYSGATKDVPPFAVVQGNHAHVHGLNSKGLARRGFDAETLRQLKRAFRLLFREHLNTTQALAAIEEEELAAPEVAHLIEFIRASERGIVK